MSSHFEPEGFVPEPSKDSDPTSGSGEPQFNQPSADGITWKRPKLPVGGRHRGNYWEGFSPKATRRVQFYSDLEYRHWWEVEFDPTIVHFLEQPGYVAAFIDGKLRMSVPDMLVRYADGTQELREIKYRQDILAPYARCERQLTVQRTWCEARGFNHRVITDDELSQNPIRQQNRRQILAYLGRADWRHCVTNCLNQLRDELLAGSRPVGELASRLGKNGCRQPYVTIFGAVFVGGLTIPSFDTHPLSAKTEVQLRIS